MGASPAGPDLPLLSHSLDLTYFLKHFLSSSKKVWLFLSRWIKKKKSALKCNNKRLCNLVKFCVLWHPAQFQTLFTLQNLSDHCCCFLCVTSWAEREFTVFLVKMWGSSFQAVSVRAESVVWGQTQTGHCRSSFAVSDLSIRMRETKFISKNVSDPKSCHRMTWKPHWVSVPDRWYSGH